MGWNSGLNYGQLMDELEKLKPETIIRFDFGYFTPKGFQSYRGYYEDVAIGYAEEYGKLTAEKFLNEMRDFLGKHYEGYKGGLFYAKRKTRLWVAKDDSQSTGTIITGVKDLEYGYAIIKTAYED